jgi:hypothetical protein
VSVAGQFRHGTGSFRAAGGEMVCHGGVSVRRSAGQGWRDVEGSMPCRCVRSARLDKAQMHGNGTRALGALGGQIGSRRRGRGGVHGHARVNRLQGIDPLDRGRPGGEVTVQEVVGGVLPKRGVHGGQWRHPVRRGVAGSVSVGWGQARGPARRRPSIGGRRRRGWSKQKRGRRVLAGWPRASLLPSMPSE